MSEIEQPNPSTELGYSTRTDVGGTVGTQPDANEAGRSDLPPQAVAPSDPSGTSLTSGTPANNADDAGKPLGDSATKLADLTNQLCPNCTTGVLEVTRYDPFALHEQNQGTALAAGHESGGAYDVHCLACDFTESRAFNPGKLWGK
jgi:hypothetical protein